MYVLKAWIGLAAVSMALAGCGDGTIEGNYPADVTPLAGSYSTVVELAGDVGGSAKALEQARMRGGSSAA